MEILFAFAFEEPSWQIHFSKTCQEKTCPGGTSPSSRKILGCGPTGIQPMGGKFRAGARTSHELTTSHNVKEISRGASSDPEGQMVGWPSGKVMWPTGGCRFS